MKTFLVLILFIFSSLSFAQSFGGSFMLGSPQGEFKKNVDRLGFGVQFQGTFWSPEKFSPFSFGMNLSYMNYGSITERRPWPGFPEVDLEVQRTNNIANFHVLVQYSPLDGSIRPYLEGLFGGAYLFTTTEVQSQNSTESIAESTNYDDLNWSYGLGAGIMIEVAQNVGKASKVFIDLKTNYLFGSEAEYLTENDIEIRSLTEIDFNPRKSTTDILFFHIGVIAFF
jgi:hypothetical protein